MRKPRIVADKGIPFLSGRMEGVADMVYLDQNDINADAVKDADALMIRTRTKCNRSLLEGSNVKVIATATIGTDHISMSDCAQLGIKVCNAPGCNAPGVAQYVWSSLLHIGVNPEKLRLGVVGCGNVGSIVSRWGESMGSEVRVSDPPKEARGEIKGYPLDEILGWADVVTFHTPYLIDGPHATHHLLNCRNVKHLRQGAVVINAARGGVTDTEALKQGISRSGLRTIIDCWEGEPEIDRDLLAMTEVATYHIAGYSYEGKQRATRMAVEAVAHELGLYVDVSDLAAPYRGACEISPEKIAESFNPMAITSELKDRPQLFERLRADYQYRKEV